MFESCVHCVSQGYILEEAVELLDFVESQVVDDLFDKIVHFVRNLTHVSRERRQFLVVSGDARLLFEVRAESQQSRLKFFELRELLLVE